VLGLYLEPNFAMKALFKELEVVDLFSNVAICVEFGWKIPR
jgi:hypothetical protein